MIYVSQIIMVYTSNLYNAACQLYLYKTGKQQQQQQQQEKKLLRNDWSYEVNIILLPLCLLPTGHFIHFCSSL